MIAASQLLLDSERVKLEPTFWIMNRLHNLSHEENTVFVHKRVEYAGVLTLTGTTPIIVRCCIVQPRLGGQLELGHMPTAEQVFGTRDPSIATRIDDSHWITISDRHYMVDATQTAYGLPGIELDYEHRLTNNMSMQMPTLSGMGQVRNGPIFFCYFSDVDFADSHASLHNVVLRTVGYASTVPSHL